MSTNHDLLCISSTRWYLSCIPNLVEQNGYKAGIKRPVKHRFLQMLSNLSFYLFNITLTKNNFMQMQRQFNAMHQARLEILEMKNMAFTDHVDGLSHCNRILKYLETKLRLATHTEYGFYYGKHYMFSCCSFQERNEATKRRRFRQRWHPDM